MDFYIIVFLTSLLGVLWFLNLVTFFKKIKEDRSTHNQTILGAVLTFFVIFSFMFFLVSLH
jgi:hypothetical protein